MSSVSSLGASVSALPSGSRPHGHRKGSQVESTDDAISNSTTAPVPAATQQNLFSSLLQSLEQVIGVQPSASTPAAAASSAAAGAGTSASAAAAAGTGTTAQSATSALQKYIGNVSQNLKVNGSPAVKLAGSNLSVNA
jgi:hypothetical protein